MSQKTNQTKDNYGVLVARGTRVNITKQGRHINAYYRVLTYCSILLKYVFIRKSFESFFAVTADLVGVPFQIRNGPKMNYLFIKSEVAD